MNIKIIMILAIIFLTEYRLLFSWYSQYLVGYTKELRSVVLYKVL